MADFVLRNLGDDLKEKLGLSAARHQRSMNAELREIVRSALTQPPSAARPIGSAWRPTSARAARAGRRPHQKTCCVKAALSADWAAARS